MERDIILRAEMPEVVERMVAVACDALVYGQGEKVDVMLFAVLHRQIEDRERVLSARGCDSDAVVLLVKGMLAYRPEHLVLEINEEVLLAEVLAVVLVYGLVCAFRAVHLSS